MIDTAETFEESYAARSKMTVDDLRERGGYVEECRCEDPACPGWAMQFAQKPEQWVKVIAKHVGRCPLGWYEGSVVKTRATTEADVILWIHVLKEMTKTASKGGTA